MQVTNSVCAAYMELADATNVEDREAWSGLVRRGADLCGLSLREMAERFSTAPGTVSRWIHGHSVPALAARRAIIDALRVEVQRVASRLEVA